MRLGKSVQLLTRHFVHETNGMSSVAPENDTEVKLPKTATGPTVTNDADATASIRLANFPLLLHAIFPTGTQFVLGTVTGILLRTFAFDIGTYVGLGVICLLPLLSSVPTWMGWNQPKIMTGRRAARVLPSSTDNKDEDVVVFLIGIRLNHPWKLTNNFAKAGRAMSEIEQELRDHPETGCLGSESFVGSHTSGSTLLLVQYWKSSEHLEKYAQSSSNKHYGPWRRLMILGKKSIELGFWHETFVVRGGDYEAIYVNCPLFGLANARGVVSEPASRMRSTMRGRLGKGVGDVGEWPEGFKDLSNY